jgi:hypothetical protein
MDERKQLENSSQAGRVQVKFFWKFSLIASILLSIIGTIILNLIF